MADWVVAHNSQRPDALERWVRSAYAPDRLDATGVQRAVDFYVEAVSMFGELDPAPYRIVENHPHRLVVQLLAADQVGAPEPDPTRVVVVEVDVDPERPAFLARGLGLGSLACEKRKQR